MTEFRFSNSTCQVEGELVPVAEINLADGDWVFFEHHVLLWKDERTPLSALQVPGGMKRMLGGMPLVITVAQGPGRVAFSATPRGSWWCSRCTPAWRSTSASTRSWWPRTPSPTRSSGSRASPTCFTGRACTSTGSSPSGEQGILLLHGYGNVFERTLGSGEKILVEPGGFLYKDSSVQMNTVQLNVRTGLMRRGMFMAEMTGPGRVGIQSMYVHHESALNRDR